MTQYYDVEAVRKLFPVVEKMTYLDSGFQTPMSTPVKQAFEAFMRESYEAAGPKSVWIDRMEETRAKVAALLNAATGEIAFTKNTSEAMNIAANALPLKAGDNVLMIHGDHPNNTCAFLNLKKKGVEVRFIPMTEIVNADSFRSHLDANTKAISISYVAFHAGHRFDIESVGALCKEKKLYFVIDIMQAVGVVPIDAKKVGATFIGSGTHKGLLVPQGLGLLYWDRARTELEPAYLAASSLENPPADFVARPDDMALARTAGRFEIGNFNLLAIQGLGAALDLINDIGIEKIEAHCFDLGDRLIAGLDALNIKLVGPRDRSNRAPHIYVVALPADEWIDYFASKYVRVSPERDGIRISLGMFNTASDIDRVLDVIKERGNTAGRSSQAA
ncbi:aminotransferase class V-fold PLP-dependent enzyme [Mesorhizobium sp. M8A.F.Ca.ET.165.01.1.1]|uniref:aminotransferase class V-fold PLP-dependent enzyme n=1 Tax=Mesorhizobium sp. M8A.F.Ca.ET.165.01.1.1 TaxID=2563960 RepID=UPI0010938401|nr:aminotransferase class V-fold PLP-dependent enzyme [Mesorhizobium sp. M8A.F.Ca.ET.165.01.1.1]TGT35755.1 aminotransferase class V-fold PLP-dependent enzyme [Mesorhizobium sp. M8A.F.Ca.ET.165.01.1.1]